MEPLLWVDHLTVCYNGRPVVKDVDFTLNQGEILGIAGESGSGKSTIIKAVMGLLGPGAVIAGGSIRYKGENVTDMQQKNLRKLLGPEIGMVFQDCQAALCPVRTVGAQIHEAMCAHGKITKKEAWQRAAEMMQKIGLEDYKRVLESYPFELSGGMNQRVGICMAMMMRPGLLLADEPTSALDVTVQKQVVDEMLLMREKYNTAMILVTHNIGVVRKMADKVLILKDGNMMEYGSRDEVLEHPGNEYTQELMNSVLHLRREAS